MKESSRKGEEPLRFKKEGTELGVSRSTRGQEVDFKGGNTQEEGEKKPHSIGKGYLKKGGNRLLRYPRGKRTVEIWNIGLS